MQSIYVFTAKSHTQITSTLDALALPGMGQQWLLPRTGPVELMIDIYQDFVAELEPELSSEITSRLGTTSVLTVAVDVSRVRAHRAATLGFVGELLTRLDGVACDDNSDYLWSREELADGTHEMMSFADGYFQAE